jgi:GNAT superfamily N-acetyltransferase
MSDSGTAFRSPETALTPRRADADRVFVAARIVDEPELRDGEPVLVRPIRLADGDKLAELHARLSPDSIYRRYFGVKSALSPAEIRRFTGIAEEWRFALVGVRSTGQLAGVARYEGQAGRSDAEIALVVDDALHHLGLGTLLLRRLVDVALISGMTSLTAVVLASNMPMLHLLRALPVPATSARESGEIEMRLHLAGLELPADRSRIAAAHVAEAAAIRTTLASSLPETGLAHLGQAFLLVHSLVVADLPEQVRERVEAAVVGLERRDKRLLLPLRVLGDKRHVLVLGMIFEVGVELIRPGPVDRVHEPGQLVVGECDGLRGPEIKPAGLFLARAGHELLQDQQVPLLVVLLGPGLRHPVVDAARQLGALRDMGDGDVGDLLPALVGNPRDQLEDLELR